MASFESNIGFTLYNNRLQISEVDCSLKNNITLRNIDTEFLSDFIDNSIKDTKFISILQNVFDELVLRKPLKSNYASFTLSENYFKHLEIPVESSLMKNDLNDFYRWNFGIAYPDEKYEDFILQTVIVNKGNSPAHLLIFLSKKIAKLLHKFCSRNNLICRFVDSSHFAAHNFIDTVEKGSVKTSLFISEEKISMIITNNFNPEFLITRSYSSNAEIKIALETINQKLISSGGDRLISSSKIYLLGENVSDSLINIIDPIFNTASEKYNPFNSINISPSLNINSFKNSACAFTPTIGIASRAI